MEDEKCMTKSHMSKITKVILEIKIPTGKSSGWPIRVMVDEYYHGHPFPLWGWL